MHTIISRVSYIHQQKKMSKCKKTDTNIVHTQICNQKCFKLHISSYQMDKKLAIS